MHRMFERFSGAYYLGRLYVEPTDGDPVMCRAQHQRVNEQLYASGDGLERTDLPLVMKVGRRHIAVDGDEGVPADTLRVPDPVLEDADVRHPPDLQEVLLATADTAAKFVSVPDRAV